MNNNISALILTYNEEKNISEAIKSVEFCDEIIVIDSYSNDKTINIIQKKFPDVKIVQHAFEDYTKQRNFAIQQTQKDWILFLDADERITEPLKKEILEVIKTPETKDVYFIKRQFFYNKKPIHFSGTQNDKNARLIKHKFAHYKNKKRVHEVIDSKGEKSVLENKMLHYSFINYETYKNKVKKYAFLKAQDLKDEGKKFNLILQIGKTGFIFFKMYFIKLGILDGKAGLILSYLSAYTTYKTFYFLKH